MTSGTSATLDVKVGVYIDGFNLYYGSLRYSPYKWLNLESFAAAYVAPHVPSRIRYFTARVTGAGSSRQQVYVRALEANPLVSIHWGHFLDHEALMPMVEQPRNGRPCMEYRDANGAWQPLPPPAPGSPVRGWVRRTEEKGSDVNLATELLRDAFAGVIDQALVVSNDSDLTSPVRVVRQELHIPVHVLSPHRRSPSAQLQKTATSFQVVTTPVLAACQLPPTVKTPKGAALSKPLTW